MAEQVSETIPPELKSQIEKACDWFVEEAKKDYHNPLQPVQQFEEKVRLDVGDAFSGLISRNLHAREVLSELLQKEEDENPEMSEDARFSTWENSFDEIRKQLSEGAIKPYSDESQKPIQEQFNISWNFLDRIYRIAESLIEEGAYQDAAAIFDLLMFLHPFVQAYGIGKARALFGAEQFEQALQQYKFCLIFDPENPAIFFEIARCHFQLKDMPQTLASLESCLSLCYQNATYKDLLAQATTIKYAIESKKLTV